MRGFRALTTMLVCAGVALAPAAAGAKTGLGDQDGLAATTQLAAMNTAIKAAPAFFAGRTTGCARVTPVLASSAGMVMAGNFRDADGYCYVWLNLQQSDVLTGEEICKTTLHEYGHLTGLQHSEDPDDVMYSPFRSDPIPAPCQAPPASSSSGKACPPGTSDADYCQSTSAAKKKGASKKKHTARKTARRK
jgi:hypothetical protein